jgi:hypothetical protein
VAVIALDDAALARLVSAAAALPVTARAGLLERFAAVAESLAAPKTIAARRRAGRARWRRHAARRRAGRAVCPVEYDGVGLGKLILSGWLARRPDDFYRPQEVAHAITDLLASGALPRKNL